MRLVDSVAPAGPVPSGQELGIPAFAARTAVRW